MVWRHLASRPPPSAMSKHCPFEQLSTRVNARKTAVYAISKTNFWPSLSMAVTPVMVVMRSPVTVLTDDKLASKVSLRSRPPAGRAAAATGRCVAWRVPLGDINAGPRRGRTEAGGFDLCLGWGYRNSCFLRCDRSTGHVGHPRLEAVHARPLRDEGQRRLTTPCRRNDGHAARCSAGRQQAQDQWPSRSAVVASSASGLGLRIAPPRPSAGPASLTLHAGERHRPIACKLGRTRLPARNPVHQG